MLASDVCGGEENGIRAQKGIPANIGRRSSNPPQLFSKTCAQLQTLKELDWEQCEAASEGSPEGRKGNKRRRQRKLEWLNVMG